MDFLEEELEEILNIFREESEEQIQKINQNLLKLEVNPKDMAVISELFREAHTIKGAARMIGLNDIQTLAHKLEDILGLAKDQILIVDANIVDILCKTVDCISSIVEESVKSKGASHSPCVDEIINQLKSIEETVSSPANKTSKVDEVKIDKLEEKYINEDEKIEEKEANSIFCKDIVNLIPEIVLSLEKLKMSPQNADIISELHRNIVTMDNSAEAITANTIKQTIQDIKVKMDWVVKGSGFLTEPEINDIEEGFFAFIKEFKNMAKAYDIIVPNDFNTVNNKIEIEVSNPKKPDSETNVIEDISLNTEVNPINNILLKSDIDFVIANLTALIDESPDAKAVCQTTIEKLKSIIISITNEEVKNIFSKILEISENIIKSSHKPNNEIIEVIRQSAEGAEDLLISPSSSTGEEPFLITQRLAILQQMIELSAQEAISTAKETEKQSKVSYSPVSKKTDILPQEEIFPDSNENSIKSSDTASIKTLRVDTKKLDQLVNQVGELIIAKIKAKEHLSEIERTTRSVEEWYREWNKAKQVLKYLDRKPSKSSEYSASSSAQNKNIYSFFEENSARIAGFMNQMNSLYRISQEEDTRLDLIVNELEEMIKSVRVLPLATIFHMFPRMVRDISREKGKEIELIISGSETSVDKKIIEEIKSPLMHIIRNSIDHGIETPDVRVKNGKNPVGKILLSAYHLENSVSIEVIDDGRGIDLEAIKKKVIEKGLLTQAELQAMNDNQIMNIIFWPGFSTGEIVTDISGRGVGLDVVHTKINQLNGKVNIKSTLGEGCKVSIQLPVTMATIKSFMVMVNNQTFAIPTSAIKTALWIKPEDIFYKEGRETIVVDNKTVPVCKLSQILEMPEEIQKDSDKVVVVIIQAEDVQVGFIIDKLLGDQEILHKNLAPPLLRVRNVAGITTLGSGELSLILNVSDLVKSAYVNFGMDRKQLIIQKESNLITAKKSILVVDDSVTTRILEKNILRAAGYNVTVAVNGLDALTKISAEKFDLVVSDVEMPEINGFELTERIRQDNRMKNLPIILVTSLASEIDKKKGLNLGANAYITKGSFNQEELLSTIRKLLAN